MTPDPEIQPETAELDTLYYRSLVSDFRAAVWCREHHDEPSDAKLMTKFVSIHKLFVRNIGRSRPELFVGMERSLLIDVIRKWMALYLRTLDELRGRFPRTEDSPDLAAEGHNWSKELGISYEGLDRLDVASRYAELWAERSVTWATTGERGEGVYESYDARVAFVGSAYYRRVDELKRTGALQLLDVAGNGVTSFDLYAALRELDHVQQLPQVLERHEWLPAGCKPGVLQAMIDAAKDDAVAIGC
ncbi:MAG: hypothetical protein R6X02_00785 [Enhygromyxa sp.]